MTATQNHPDPLGPDTTTTGRDGDSGHPEVRGPGARGTVPRSRMGGVWVALVVAALVLRLVALPGTARIVELRMLGRRRSGAVEPSPPHLPDTDQSRGRLP